MEDSSRQGIGYPSELREVAGPYHECTLLSLAPRYNAPALSASVYTPPSSRRCKACVDWGETEECSPATGASSSVETLEEILAYVTDASTLHNRLIVSRAFEYPLAVKQLEVFRRAVYVNPPSTLRTLLTNAEHGCRGVAEAGLPGAARFCAAVYLDEADNEYLGEIVYGVYSRMTEWPPPLKGISFPKLRSMIKPAVLGSQADGCKAAYSTVVSGFRGNTVMLSGKWQPRKVIRTRTTR
ncbi:hypothetical protein EYR36_004095 [Pleurotus pulmonarius]|nr:hypothetical protein EYR36_004095 [Pleurotus pulmonarius]